MRQAAAIVDYNRRRVSPSPPAVVFYVDSVAGSDANTGTSAGDALATLSAAMGRLGGLAGTIRVSAPEAAPLRDAFVFTGAQPVVIESQTPGTPWYMAGSVQYGASGWTSEGGGVYSRAHTVAPPETTLYSVTVTTLTNAYGHQLRLIKNEDTPAAPAAGEFGWEGGVLYVHLPADADPAGHIIEAQQRYYCIRTTGAGMLTVTDGVFRYARYGIENRGGRVTAADCTAEYNFSGFAVERLYSESTYVNCLAQENYNDGFNHHAYDGASPVMTMVDCEGAYNGDEGASPHDHTVMIVQGGRYHHNVSAGIGGINSAKMILDGVLCDLNNTDGGDPDWGGIVYFSPTMSGSCTDCICKNNTGRGFYAAIGTPIVITNLTSGLAAGNTLPDQLPA